MLSLQAEGCGRAWHVRVGGPGPCGLGTGTGRGLQAKHGACLYVVLLGGISKT